MFVQSRHLKFWCGGIKAVILWKWNKLHWVGMLILTHMGRLWLKLYFASGQCHFSFAAAVFKPVFRSVLVDDVPLYTGIIDFHLIIFPSSEP